MLGKEPHGMMGVFNVAVFSIGATVDKNRESAGSIGTENVGGQTGAVTHGYHDVSLASHLVLLRLSHDDALRELPTGFYKRG
jgi:hypothetical protein